MKKTFILSLIGAIILLAISILLLSKGCNTLVKEYKYKYEQPDTTITYKNGKWDTIITKKTAPSWLK